MAETITIPALQAMKREGRKIVGIVAWDYQIARIADRAGVDIVSVGDSVGVNLWGHSNPLEVTCEEMLIVCKAVRRGVARALVSCDFPFGPLQEGAESAVRTAISRRLETARASSRFATLTQAMSSTRPTAANRTIRLTRTSRT